MPVYNTSNYGYLGKGYNSPIVGKHNSGREFKIHLSNDRNTDSDEEDLDDFVDDVNKTSKKNINKKIVTGMAMTGTDQYSFRNKDNAAGQLKNTGGSNIFEYGKAHKTFARKGISPFKQKKHSGGPIGTGGSGQAFRTTGNFVGIGTQYGSSRPHKILTKIDNDRIFNLQDIDAPFQRAFKRQQNKIKKVLSIIKEYVSLEY
tara:strand:+ start:1856 stop:2461 length:606 start_codon:yes stop_codon:yes gene_type:complete